MMAAIACPALSRTRASRAWWTGFSARRTTTPTARKPSGDFSGSFHESELFGFARTAMSKSKSMTSEVIDRVARTFDSRSADQSSQYRKERENDRRQRSCQPLYRSVERENTKPPARDSCCELGR